MFSPKGRSLLLVFFLLSLPLLSAQSSQEAGGLVDPASLVGLTLDELISRFGTPRSVYAARGLEEWQDDVVFVYEQGDFYIYKDRVWQLGLKAARGLKAGDSRGVVFLILGSKAESRGDSIFFSLDEKPWPLMLRCDFDSEGKLVVIFIYRPDF